MTDKIWASEEVGANLDWIEFNVPAPEDEWARHIKVDVTFMLSKWACIYGKGCAGIQVTGVTTDTGCCEIGVHIGDDEFKRLKGAVDQLTEEDCDNIELVRKRWTRRDHTTDDYQRKTRVVNGACILANRAGGAAGKPGCSLHVLANRLGVHPSETKPDICWQVPISVSEEWDEDTSVMTIVVSNTTGTTWGNPVSNGVGYPHYWCTETPDAFVAKKPVYRTQEYELRKLMGDKAYDMMVERLQEIEASGGRRYKMPGEVANGGRSMIPLLVEQRVRQWIDEGEVRELKRSRKYLESHVDDKLFAKVEKEIGGK